MKMWGMKTFKHWGAHFVANGFVGIDQEGVDQDFRTIKDNIADELIDEEFITRPIIRNFKQFVYDMKIGDMIAIGVGKMTRYNITAIVKVTGDYQFNPNSPSMPRHTRSVEIVNSFTEPVSYNEFNRMSRLEFLSEYDWNEMLSHIFKN